MNQARCDELWSKVVLARSKRHCCICGKPATEAHHLVSRRHMLTRYMIVNGLALCHNCHTAAHYARAEFAKKLPPKLADIAHIMLRATKMPRTEKTDYFKTATRLRRMLGKYTMEMECEIWDCPA